MFLVRNLQCIASNPSKFALARRKWKLYHKNYFTWAFFCVNNAKDVNLENPQNNAI